MEGNIQKKNGSLDIKLEEEPCKTLNHLHGINTKYH